VEYGRIVSDAWTVTVRTRPLWWLGAIASAQVALFAVVVAGLSVPMTVLPQVVAASDRSAAVAFDGSREQVLLTVAQWLGNHLGAITIGAAIVFSVGIVLGVVDVAAETGIVTQVNAVAEKRVASARAGMRDGFRLWWRVVALLALAALPSLTYMLVMAIAMTLTVSLPLYLGNQPDPGAVLLTNLALSPLSVVVSLMAVPLYALVQLGVRFGILDDLEWRSAFYSAWRLAKANLVEVALTYALVGLVTMLAMVAFVVVASACTAILGGLVLGVALAATAGDVASAGRIALWGAAGSFALLFLAFEAVMFVWQSSVWTLVWRDRTGRRSGSHVTGRASELPRRVAASTTEGGL